MATNRDLLKEAIADAKTVKDTAIANAKAALEEAFTPYLKEKLAAKINEMDEAEEEVKEEMYDEAEKMDEMKGEKEEMDEVSLDELLAELEEEKPEMEENLHEAEAEEEEEISIEDMSEDDLKSFIEDVIKDMVAAGELEAGHEGMEKEEGAEGEEEVSGEEELEEVLDEELDEEINLDEILAEEKEEEEEKVDEILGLGIKAKEKAFRKDIAKYANAWASKGIAAPTADEIEKIVADARADKFEGRVGLSKDKKMEYRKSADIKYSTGLEAGGTGGLGRAGSGMYENAELEEAYATIKILKSELNEINLLNAKLLYTNKIFRNKSLTESQKIKVLTAFDKATTKQEAQLIYETLQESLKVSVTKSPIKESLGSASKVLGSASAKPIIENDAFSRMRELAFGNKK